MDLVKAARMFAWGAHSAVGQKRKYTGEDYAVHTDDVAYILQKFAFNPVTSEMIAAAHLHDSVEDTGVTIEQIKYHFGETVAEYVGWLTDVSKPEDGNRKARKAKDLAHTASAPVNAKTIKLADLISNSSTIVQYDPGFAGVYLREKSALLDYALYDADPGLYAEASRILADARMKLFGE